MSVNTESTQTSIVTFIPSVFFHFCLVSAAAWMASLSYSKRPLMMADSVGCYGNSVVVQGELNIVSNWKILLICMV